MASSSAAMRSPISWNRFFTSLVEQRYLFSKNSPDQRTLSHNFGGLASIEDQGSTFRRAYSTRRVLPNVQVSEAALSRARSLRVPKNKYQNLEGYQDMNTLPYPDGGQKPYRHSSASRSRGNLNRYRQSTIAASSVSPPSSNMAPRLSPNLNLRVETRHQPRSARTLEKPEQRTRRQLPSTALVSNNTKLDNKEEIESIASTLDDFDYFCSISYSPNGKITPTYPKESTQMRRQRMKGMRSHSMLHPNESFADYQSNSSSLNIEGSIEDYHVDRRAISRTLTNYNQDVLEEITPKRLSGNASRNNSYVSLAQCSRTSYSPARVPIAPQPPSHIASGSGEMPLGAAISQEALDADDPDLVEFKVQVLGWPSVGKSTICQRLAKLNGDENDDFNDDTEDEYQALSVKATLDGKVFNVAFTETLIYAAEDSMNIEIQECVDAFVVVYAIDDEFTFEYARRILLALRDSIKVNSLPPAGFIFVGNKSDLVRGREVPTEEGNQFATAMKAKFIEVSAVLDHKIPELLLTIITHLRELEEAKGQRPKGPPTNEMWATSRKIAVKMSAKGLIRGSDEFGGCHSCTSTGHGGGQVGMSATGDARTGKKPAKKEIVKFFKKHFSKSIVEDSVAGREILE
ncbi:unnamed protein product [Rodentolepis nana]|uniref:Small monomeric GTPase n=1 Tax=Rodentolepis nana TaxID=102285 RepID=A0A0R3TNV4_RODNA|nr:unnamed protein product [Rodentolepis nana]